MICPVCKIDMMVVERNKIELDYCYKCGGTWFDAGELDLLLASVPVGATNVLTELMSSDEVTTTEKHRKCPICGRNMHKVHAGQQTKTLIDTCDRGDGLWFDGGEVGQLLTEMSAHPLAGPGAQVKIAEFLGDAFHARTPVSGQHPGHSHIDRQAKS